VKLAIRELVREPTRFVIATGALTLLVVLLLLLGGLLDGLFLGSTGAIRTQDADAFVYSGDARTSFLRSRIDPELRQQVEAVDGVDDAGGLGIALLAAQVPGEGELADTAVVGYERPTNDVPAPPPPGQAWADERLKASGVEQGETLAVGPEAIPIEVVGFVDDTNYLLQGGLWVEPATWRELAGSARPDAAVGEGVFQVLVVAGADGEDAEALTRRIDEATGGATESLTKADAVFSLPGTREQNNTFNQVIGVTFFVAGLVIALFFVLLTIERLGLYGVLKALGASTGELIIGVVTQAVVVAAIAFALGWLIARGLALVIPDEVPVRLEPSRAVFVAGGILLAAVLGAAVSLRRIARIDPASAIGTAS